MRKEPKTMDEESNYEEVLDKAEEEEPNPKSSTLKEPLHQSKRNK